MRAFCLNPNNGNYARYGGRGIAVEFDSFGDFKEWSLANGYADDLTIDRVDNDGNYSRDNCRWATRTTQARNKSSNVLDANRVRELRKLRDEGLTLIAIAKRLGVSKSAVAHVVSGRTWVDQC